MEDIIQAARAYALGETEKYWTPKKEHLILSFEKGQELAKTLGANKDIIALGTLLMDIKLGECSKEGNAAEHVQKSTEASKIFLQKLNVASNIIEEVLVCVNNHHWTNTHYPSLEAEICANADCYRILHPRWFISIIILFGKRNEDTDRTLAQVENKVEEKYNILSLDICKQELEPYYYQFKKLILEAKEE